jgi:hypothetical protein
LPRQGHGLIPICGAHRRVPRLDSWLAAAIGYPAALAERESEQAGAQQHEAGCGQREKSVGHKVMFTHDTPVALDALPNSLKVSESVFFNELFGLATGQARERKPSKAWARKMPTLTRPRNAVTVSNIANVLCAPAGTERLQRCTVKRIPRQPSIIGSD